MIKISLNDNWRYSHLGEEDWQNVTLPHDAMLSENRSEDVAGGKNTGYFEGRDYCYERDLVIEKKQGECYYLEFEGVYRNAKIFLNGNEVAFRPYGYTDFTVEITEQVVDGVNKLRVEAYNSDLPNSRWYSGAGIYRPVWLYILPEKHIELNSVKINTRDYRMGTLDISVRTSHPGKVYMRIYDNGKEVDSDDKEGIGYVSLFSHIRDVKLWSPEDPHLYTMKVFFADDVQEFTFGVRKVECDARNGLRINGKRVVLRGACIHHDNGFLGACAYPDAEERKVKLLQQAGYNAIRSAHNPCSKALLEACDRLGMLVMDEYVDMWYVHKCRYDYATYVQDWWEKDLKDMVDKDYNHPSVILYSTGNEVGETSEKKGISLTGRFTYYLHSLDRSRPVTCGINIWFNAMYRMGFGQYTDKKAEKAAQAKSDKDKKKQAVGSEFFNNLAGVVGAGFMKTMAMLPVCDWVTKKAFAKMDVAGYNYGIKRYAHDIEKYPERVIVGSETFVKDACRFWSFAKDNKAMIGDFVWAGMDYLGEVGIGSMEYADYAKDFNGGLGWISAGSGRLDLTGKETAEAKYTKVAFDLLPIAMAVVPVNHTEDKHSPTAWSMTNAKESWTWTGCEGKKALVEVYADAYKVKLFLNDNLVAEKKNNKDRRVILKTVYNPGTLTAVGYDKEGKEVCRTSLTTADEKTVLSLLPETESVKKNGLLYVRVQYADEKGIVKPLIRGDVKMSVAGGKLLGFGSACPYYERSYQSDTADTYFGEALAIILADGDKVSLHAESPFGSADAEIPVV